MTVTGFTTLNGARFDPADDTAHKLLADRLRGQIAQLLSAHALDAGGALPLERKTELAQLYLDEAIDSFNAAQIRAGRAGLDPHSEAQLRTRVRAALLGLGGLQVLMDDPDVETINVNGCDLVFATRVDGTVTKEQPIADSDEQLVDLVRALARSGDEERRFDKGVARLNAQLPDGSRLFAAMGVSKRPCLSIRRNLLKDATLPELEDKGLLDARLAKLLTALVGAKFNLLISGGTSAGKTTLLRALINTLPVETRLVTIEDTFELNLDAFPDKHRDVVAYQAREANTEGHGEIRQAELVRWALRMSPDRVIVGEIRNDELIPMCNAMNQGLDGSMATVHASSSAQVVERVINIGLQCEEHLPAEATVRLLGSAVDFILQLGRTRAGTRVVTSVREVCGSDGANLITNEVWRPGPDQRAAPAVPLRPQSVQRLIDAGYDPAGWE